MVWWERCSAGWLPLVTFGFPGFPEYEWLRFPGGGRLASMLEVGRLAFWKECKEKTAVRNSSELRGKAGDQLQWLWQ